MNKLLNKVLIVFFVLIFLIGCSSSRSNVPVNLKGTEVLPKKDYSGDCRNMYLKQFYVPSGKANIYLLASKTTNDAVLIDFGGYDLTHVDDYLRSKNLNLKALLLTHGHGDHVLGSSLVQMTKNVAVYMHKADENFFGRTINIIKRTGMNDPGKPTNIKFVKEGDNIIIGDIQIKVLHTPGHSKGSVCYYIQNGSILFTGDTLFKGLIGNPNFAGGNMSELKNSVNRLLLLPYYTSVYPGHLETTTIEKEKKDNIIHTL